MADLALWGSVTIFSVVFIAITTLGFLFFNKKIYRKFKEKIIKEAVIESKGYNDIDNFIQIKRQRFKTIEKTYLPTLGFAITLFVSHLALNYGTPTTILDVLYINLFVDGFVVFFCIYGISILKSNIVIEALFKIKDADVIKIRVKGKGKKKVA